MNEIKNTMNFETEQSFKPPTNSTVKESKTIKNNLEGLLKKFFHLKLKSGKLPDINKTVKLKKHNVKVLFGEERLKFWDDITRKESKEFHKLDQISKINLSNIIPAEITRKRFQDLVIPKESAPNTLKRVFQYLAHTVKSDLIAECTIEQLTNYRPLTFSPELIHQESFAIDANDWHAANLMIFQNLANLLYGISLEFCNPSCCPIMTVGKGYEYMWCDGATFVNPISVPARTYMKFCLLWTQKQLKDPKVLYSTDSFTVWIMIYRRLLRVYAHLYINHQADFKRIGSLGSVLRCMLRRFLLYGIENGLTSKKELVPIKEIYKKIQSEFRSNEPYK